MARMEIVVELRRIQDSNGGLLRAVDVVTEASRADSPLHEHFTWEDSVAGHQWRLHQARQLIRVTVETLPYDEPRYMVRAFVSLSPDRLREDGGYRSTTVVLRSPNDRRQLLADALEELSRIRVRFSQLEELVEIFRAIDRAQRDNDGDGPSPPPDDDRPIAP